MKTILTTVLMLILGASSLFAQAPQIYTTSGAVMNGGNKFNDAVLMFVDDNGNVTVGIINGDETRATIPIKVANCHIPFNRMTENTN